MTSAPHRRTPVACSRVGAGLCTGQRASLLAMGFGARLGRPPRRCRSKLGASVLRPRRGCRSPLRWPWRKAGGLEARVVSREIASGGSALELLSWTPITAFARCWRCGLRANAQKWAPTTRHLAKSERFARRLVGRPLVAMRSRAPRYTQWGDQPRLLPAQPRPPVACTMAMLCHRHDAMVAAWLPCC